MKYAMEQPYGEWLEDNLTQLKDIKIPNKADIKYSEEEASAAPEGIRNTHTRTYSGT